MVQEVAPAVTALFVLVIGNEWVNTTTVLEDELTPTELFKEKDAEIKELHARLKDKGIMINALSAAARHRDVADLASDSVSPDAPQGNPSSKQRQQRQRGKR